SVCSGGLRVLRVKVLLTSPRTNADGAITIFRLQRQGPDGLGMCNSCKVLAKVFSAWPSSYLSFRLSCSSLQPSRSGFPSSCPGPAQAPAAVPRGRASSRTGVARADRNPRVEPEDDDAAQNPPSAGL